LKTGQSSSASGAGDTRPVRVGLGAQVFSSLRFRSFRFLWFSTLFASAGNWIQQITLGWLAYDLTQSAFLTAVSQGLRAVPFLVASPLGGVIADRVDRRKLLIATQGFLAVSSVAFALIVLSGALHIWHLMVFSFATGCAWAFNNPVRQALVFNTVPRATLANAIALNSSAFNATRVLGPVTGGLLIGMFGAGTNFLIQALAYVLVCVMVLGVRVNPLAEAEGGRKRRSVAGTTLDGFAFVRRDRTIMGLILLALIPTVFLMPFTNSLMPVFAAEQLGIGPKGLGVLISAFGVGALIGTLSLAVVTSPRAHSMIQVTAAVTSGVFLIALAETRLMALALPLIVIIGGAQMLYNATNQTILQSIVPDEYRGRVMGIYMLNFGFVPLGSTAGGLVADRFGLPIAMIGGGVITVTLILVVAFRFRLMTHLAERRESAAAVTSPVASAGLGGGATL